MQSTAPTGLSCIVVTSSRTTGRKEDRMVQLSQSEPPGSESIVAEGSCLSIATAKCGRVRLNLVATKSTASASDIAGKIVPRCTKVAVGHWCDCSVPCERLGLLRYYAPSPNAHNALHDAFNCPLRPIDHRSSCLRGRLVHRRSRAISAAAGRCSFASPVRFGGEM